MVLSISKKPATYRGRVHWYASAWRSNEVYVFRTKREAIAKARTLGPGTVRVDWFAPHVAPRIAISKTAIIYDER